MKLAFTKQGRDQAVRERAQRDAQPKEQYRSTVALATPVPLAVITALGLGSAFLVADAAFDKPLLGFILIAALFTLIVLLFPYRSLVATDQRLLVYKANPLTSDPGALLQSVSLADVKVRAVHSGWLRPFVLEVNSRHRSFYTYSMAYWQDAPALCRALGSNAAPSSA